MSRISLSRLTKLEKIGNRVTEFRYMTDEQLLEVCCNYEPDATSSVIPAFRAGGLDAGFDQLFSMRFGDDPERLALVLESYRRHDCETVARMLGGGNARAI